MTLLNFDCGNQTALVGYVYDECDAVECAAITAHLIICSRCAADVASLHATRTALTAWTPPEAQLGFRIVSDRESTLPVASTSATVLRPSRWWRQPMPAWAQAAAAVLIFTVGAGLGALRGTTMQAPAAAESAAGVNTPPASQTAVSRDDLTALEQRLRSEFSQRVAAPASVSGAPVQANSALLQQVRDLIQNSEKRQQQELALRTAEVIRDFDTQRRGDLARIEQTFGQMEGATGVQVEQQRQMLNYLMRVSQTPR